MLQKLLDKIIIILLKSAHAHSIHRKLSFQMPKWKEFSWLDGLQ